MSLFSHVQLVQSGPQVTLIVPLDCMFEQRSQYLAVYLPLLRLAGPVTNVGSPLTDLLSCHKLVSVNLESSFEHEGGQQAALIVYMFHRLKVSPRRSHRQHVLE